MVLFPHDNNANVSDVSCRLCLESLIGSSYSKSYKILPSIAKTVLGSYYNKLKQFYSDIFMLEEYQYIVFVARRSISLAEVFFTILWHENDDSSFRAHLERCWVKATTDSTIMALTKEIALTARRGPCPRILVVDDLLVQGNGLNELLSTIEKNVLCYLTSPGDNITSDTLWQDIINSIDIQVFAQNNTMSVVKLQYQLQLKPKYRMTPKEWHDLSRRISSLISFSGTANAAFIMGVELPCALVEKRMLQQSLHLNEETAIEAVCENRDTFYERHTFGWSSSFQPLPKFYCTLRALKNQFTDRYTLMPFIFLPQLTDHSYHYLKEKVMQKWQVSVDSCPVFCENGCTSRLEYEAIILHLSESLLMCWTQASGIKLTQENYVPTKVALNFGINRQTPLIDQDIFYRLANPSYLFTWNELTALLCEITASSKPLINEYPIFPENDVRKKIEDNIYLTKVQELFESCRSSQMLAQTFKPILNYTFKQTNWNIFLEEFTACICEQVKGISANQLFRCLLSFMDHGIVTLKTRQSKTLYAQVLRMGEQSLFIWPQRYASYYPVLSYLKTRKTQHDTDLITELSNFLHHQQSHGKLASSINVDTLTVELITYLETLCNSGQEPEDWDIGFEKSLLLDLNVEQLSSKMRRFYLQERLNFIEASRIRRTMINDCHEFYSL